MTLPKTRRSSQSKSSQTVNADSVLWTSGESWRSFGRNGRSHFANLCAVYPRRSRNNKSLWSLRKRLDIFFVQKCICWIAEQACSAWRQVEELPRRPACPLLCFFSSCCCHCWCFARTGARWPSAIGWPLYLVHRWTDVAVFLTVYQGTPKTTKTTAVAFALCSFLLKKKNIFFLIESKCECGRWLHICVLCLRVYGKRRPSKR